MNAALDDYLEISSRWLVETTSIYDLAESAARAAHPGYAIPLEFTWQDGPFMVSKNGPADMQAAMPIIIKTSLEHAKAAEIAMDSCEKFRIQRDKRGPQLKVPLVVDQQMRTGPIVARSGIIAQFELWKSFVQPLNYPFNKRRAEGHKFKSTDEQDALMHIIDRRNELTHEITVLNDPNMREYVEYVCHCHFLARTAASTSC